MSQILQQIYKINEPIEVRYLAKDKESGLTDLSFTVTQPDGVDLSPTLMTELEPGLYQAFFTPNTIGYWWARVASVSAPSNVFTQTFFVAHEYYPAFLTDGQMLKTNYDNNEDGIVDNAFLPDFHYIEDNTISATTSITPQNKLTFNWTPAFVGDYIIEWYFETSNLTINNNNYRIQLNGLDIAIAQVKIEPEYSNNGWKAISGFIKKPLTVSNQTLTLDYWAVASTAGVKNARFKMYRVQ